MNPTPSPDSLPLPDAAPADTSFHRSIRSFVRRTGRTTLGQAKAFEDVGPRFLLPYNAAPLDFSAAFQRSAPTVLEIGFGMGEATAHIAAQMPETNFLCCEVHTPGVGALLKRIAEQGLENIRILQHDAVEVIDHMLPLGSLDGVHIFFPDPWHKKKHNKRRLIQAPLISKLAARLKAGGYLHCATELDRNVAGRRGEATEAACSRGLGSGTSAGDFYACGSHRPIPWPRPRSGVGDTSSSGWTRLGVVAAVAASHSPWLSVSSWASARWACQFSRSVSSRPGVRVRIAGSCRSAPTRSRARLRPTVSSAAASSVAARRPVGSSV